MAERICVAQIGGAHGLRGEVKLKSFTADPMALTGYGPLTTEDGSATFEIELETLALILGQQRVEKSEPLDEAAVARRTAVRNDDVVDRPFLGPGAGETDLQRHLIPF